MTAPLLRVGINLGNKALVRQDGNHLTGLAPDIARFLADRLHAFPEFCLYDSAALLAADYRDGWDIAFLAIEASRRATLAFSRPYTSIQATLALRAEQSAMTCREVLDNPRMKILSARGAAYHVQLEKQAHRAMVVSAASPGQAIACGRSGEAHAVAGVRQSLEEAFGADPEWRVLPDNFVNIDQAVAVAHSRMTLLAEIDNHLLELSESLGKP